MITLQEIENQFETWEKIDSLIEINKELIGDTKDFITADTMVVFTGAGTSGYIGDVLIPHLNNKAISYNFHSIYSPKIVSNPESCLAGKKVLLVSFGRSGNSPESIEAIKLAKLYCRELKLINITCDKEGKLAQYSERETVILPNVTNDQGFAMTNSFSNMLLFAAKMFDLNINISELIKTSRKIYDNFKYEEVLNSDFENIIFLSDTQDIGIINELKLKCLELTAGHYNYYHEHFLNFRHGPKSVITKKSIIFIFTSKDYISKLYADDLINELRSDENKPKVIVMNEIDKDYDAAEGFIRSFSVIPAFQKMAVLLSISLGINPDNPSPSGSVNRVVKGVIIHGRIDAD